MSVRCKSTERPARSRIQGRHDQPESRRQSHSRFQPDELEILGEYIYVANSGGYRAPEYDNTVSVIELNRFKQVQKIPVGINLHRIRADKYGKLWVTSRGDYDTVHSNLYVLEKRKGYNENGGYRYPEYPLL